MIYFLFASFVIGITLGNLNVMAALSASIFISIVTIILAYPAYVNHGIVTLVVWYGLTGIVSLQLGYLAGSYFVIPWLQQILQKRRQINPV